MSNHTPKHTPNPIQRASKVEIIHNIYDIKKVYRHSLTINGEEGLRVAYNEIARNGSFCAVTHYYTDYFPEIFLITDFSSISMKCSIQSGGIKKTTKVI